MNLLPNIMYLIPNIMNLIPKDNKEASISEIHEFVKKIPALTQAHKVLDQHINIAEQIKQVRVCV